MIVEGGSVILTSGVPVDQGLKKNKKNGHVLVNTEYGASRPTLVEVGKLPVDKTKGGVVHLQPLLPTTGGH